MTQHKIQKPILTAYYLTLATFLLSSFFPEARLWGINWFAYFPVWITLLVFSLAALLPLILKQMSSLLIEDTSPSSFVAWFWILGSTVFGTLILFYLFSAKTHFLGDGYLMLSRLENRSAVIRPWNPGIYYLRETIYDLLGGTGKEHVLLTFQLISYFSGLSIIIATGLAAFRWFSNNLERFLFVLLVITGGHSLLFFGYVENYPVFIMLVAIFSLAGIEVSLGHINRWFLLLIIILAALFHPFTAALIPPAIYLSIRKTKVVNLWHSIKIQNKIALLLIPLSIGGYLFVSTYFSNYFLRFAILPFLPNEFTVDGYWMFSGKHITDMINLLLLLIPGLFVFLTILFKTSVKNVFVYPEYRFLGILFLSSLAITFIFDPKLGLPRDWDLFSLIGLPVLLFAGYFLFDNRFLIKGRTIIAALIITLNMVILIPRLASQIDPAISISLFDSYAHLDHNRNHNGAVLVLNYLDEQGKQEESKLRRDEWDSLYPQDTLHYRGQALAAKGEYKKAITVYRQLLEMDPSFYPAWSNLGVIYSRLKQYDSAVVCMKIADGMNPYNPDTWTNMGGVYMEMGNQKLAEKYWIGAIPLNPNNLMSRLFLLQLYEIQAQQKQYNITLSEIAWHDKAPLKFLKLYSESLLKRNEYDSARVILQRSLDKGLDSSYIWYIQKTYPLLQNRK